MLPFITPLQCYCPWPFVVLLCRVASLLFRSAASLLCSIPLLCHASLFPSKTSRCPGFTSRVTAVPLLFTAVHRYAFTSRVFSVPGDALALQFQSSPCLCHCISCLCHYNVPLCRWFLSPPSSTFVEMFGTVIYKVLKSLSTMVEIWGTVQGRTPLPFDFFSLLQFTVCVNPIRQIFPKISKKIY